MCIFFVQEKSNFFPFTSLERLEVFFALGLGAAGATMGLRSMVLGVVAWGSMVWGSAGLGAAVLMMIFLIGAVVFIFLGFTMVSITTTRFLAASIAAREAAMRATEFSREVIVPICRKLWVVRSKKNNEKTRLYVSGCHLHIMHIMCHLFVI